MGIQIVFASTNPHKLQEIRHILPKRFTLLDMNDIGFQAEVEETGKTFEANAELKANAIYESSGLMCFADDSGLEVDALDGKPGVKSARYSGEPPDHARNVEFLLSNMRGKTNRKARFKTVICLRYGSRTLFFEGTVEGRITEEPRGINGFGYDPVFMPDGYDRTFAEMTMDEKNAISHRKRAVEKMLEFIAHIN